MSRSFEAGGFCDSSIFTKVSSLSADPAVESGFRAGFLERLGHPLFVEGLEQVIDGVDFKGFDRVLVKGGGEDNLGQRDACGRAAS